MFTQQLTNWLARVDATAFAIAGRGPWDVIAVTDDGYEVLSHVDTSAWI